MKTYLLLLAVLFTACTTNTNKEVSVIKIEGATMGTTYHITYIDSNGVNYKKAVDSLLVEINHSMSTYDPNSIISAFNNEKNTDNWVEIDRYFMKVMQISKIVYDSTGGAFDPTVMPLVKAFGFGPNGKLVLDSTVIDSLRQLVDFKLVDQRVVDAEQERHLFVRKTKPGVMLDFSAVAKGYGVDQVGALLQANGINNYMVEIGGEVLCKGVNAIGELWTIGIDKPTIDNATSHSMMAAMHLDNSAMATSGNYRNYKMNNGVKYVHTINPFTGYPEENTTLSVSVVTYSCGIADAYATAFMVLGVDKALPLAQSLKNVEAYFIYSDENGELKTVSTTGLENAIVILPQKPN